MIKKSKVNLFSGARSPKQGACRAPLSDQEAVKTWLRDYSNELAGVGIQLGLTPTQKTALENRLLLIYQGWRAESVTKPSFTSPVLIDDVNDPLNVRWIADQMWAQVGSQC